MKRLDLRFLPFLLGLTLLVVGTRINAQEPSQVDQETADRIEACMGCHSKEAGAGPAVDLEKLRQSPHASFDCQTCHDAITELPHTPQMTAKKPQCATCHADEVEAFRKSTHSREDYVKGDHPSCVFCHGGGAPHAITAGSKWTREQKVQVCTQCHSQTERMERYHVDPEAVTSYLESFHGKALLRFGNYDTAICTDCHSHHDVLAPMNPAAPTYPTNVAKTCGQEGCHPGSQANFALSGANHLRLKIKHDSLLAGVLWFFRLLIFGTIAFMAVSIILDLVQVVFRSQEPPRCGRPAGIFISLSYFSLIATIIIVTVRANGAGIAAWATLAFLVLAWIAYFFRRNRHVPVATQRLYPRMNLNLRLQHFLLLSSVTALVATGLPLRFAAAQISVQELNMIGGLDNSRLIHRIAAVGLIVVAIWHVLYLLARWRKFGGSIRSWRMLPNKKDLEDFNLVTKGYLGMTKEKPKFDHFTFRSKIDYLAEYWGVPVMVLSGLVLWFPMYFSTWMPEAAWPISFIAHGYEATLAFLAVVCWHLYNVLFNPNNFPFNTLWITGKLTREEMSREHPLELERLDAADMGDGGNGE
ncbi:MAG: cytochrome b/b6 domain-containing protein [Fimbriimonadaceae bacterium]|nr:cytochrome b/b6 domain-containing protein [Chthonomonadaceae bacterium]MCO5295753.1 cytochrome b/b6 domain-containing protein [Fimbriimonadaceae bacterium]